MLKAVTPSLRPDWLEASRADAREALSKLALPGLKDPNFRSTSLRDVLVERPADAPVAAPALPGELAAPNEGESLVITCRSGKDSPVAITGLASGVEVSELATAARKHAELLAPFLSGVPAGMEGDFFATWHASEWTNGVFVRVPRGQKLEQALRAVQFFDESHSTFFHRLLILAEEGSEVTMTEELAGSGKAGTPAPLAVGVVQVIARKGARVRYSQVQHWGSCVQYFARQSFCAEEGAEIRYTPVLLGGQKGQLRTEALCSGPRSAIHTRGAARGDDSQHFDFWTVNKHPVPDTKSSMEFWSVMTDRARAVFNGTIVITPEGVRTEASQKNRNMLLSTKAAIDSFPKLEIATDDVSCAHGASITPIDVEQLFYLQSRGVPAAEAEKMIIDGFTEPAILDLPTEALRERVHAILARKHVRALQEVAHE